MKKNRAYWMFSVVAAVALSIGGISCNRGGGGGQATGDTIKIGAVLPLTGELSQLQVVLKNGMELATQEVNDAGGINGKKLQIVYQDNQGDPKQSVSAFQQLIASDNPPVTISDISPLSIPLRPLADQNKVLLLSTLV